MPYLSLLWQKFMVCFVTEATPINKLENKGQGRAEGGFQGFQETPLNFNQQVSQLRL